MTYIINFFSYLLISISFLVGFNLFMYINKLKEKIEIRVFLKDEANIDSLKKEIKKMGIKEIVFVSKEEAIHEFIKEVENGAILLQRIEKNPLPASFKISIKEITEKNINAIKEKITKIDEITDFVYDKEAIKKLDKINKFTLWIGIPISSIIFIIFIFTIIGVNHKRKEKCSQEIKILQTFGINKNKIILKFRIKAIIETIILSGLSIVILYFITEWLLPKVIMFLPYLLIAEFIAGLIFISFIITILQKFQ